MNRITPDIGNSVFHLFETLVSHLDSPLLKWDLFVHLHPMNEDKRKVLMKIDLTFLYSNDPII